MNTRELSIATTERFVLDEADRMLDLGFIKDIRHIVSALPTRRQSATAREWARELRRW